MSVPGAEELARLAARFHAAPTVTETADEVVRYALQQMDADHAGITILRRGGRLTTIAPSSPLVTRIDELQIELDEGTCRHGTWEGGTIRAPELAHDSRWPRWGGRVAALGVTSALAVELSSVDDARIGALHLYWERSRRFSADDVAFAHVFARHAAVALSSTMKEANLRVALDTRKQIGQAQGILMERFDLDADQAFDVLRRYSQDHNVKLRDVAAQLVRTRRLTADVPGAETAAT